MKVGETFMAHLSTPAFQAFLDSLLSAVAGPLDETSPPDTVARPFRVPVLHALLPEAEALHTGALAPAHRPAGALLLPHGWEALQGGYDALHARYTTFLRRYGVTMPRMGTQKMLGLLFLHRNVGRLVHQNEVADFIARFVPCGSKDKQPRHLKYDGWHVLLSGKSGDLLPVDVRYTDTHGRDQARAAGSPVPPGYLMLASDTTPSPDFIQGKRQADDTKGTWAAVCAAHGHCCAVCGKSSRTLEKGHIDPFKPATLDNLLPMCPSCNNWASSDVIFDRKGRVAALASARFVKSSPLAAKIRILDALLNDPDLQGLIPKDSPN